MHWTFQLNSESSSWDLVDNWLEGRFFTILVGWTVSLGKKLFGLVHQISTFQFWTRTTAILKNHLCDAKGSLSKGTIFSYKHFEI